MTEGHVVLRAVSGDNMSGWTVTFKCRSCTWSSEATAPTVQEAQSIQLVAKDRHVSGGQDFRSQLTGGGGIAASTYPEPSAPAAEETGCGGCLGLVLGAVLLLALLGSCFSSGDEASSYSNERCAALELSIISGDDSSVGEYANNCE